MSKYDAVKSTGSGAVQGSPMLITVGVVGNSLIQSNHGIFRVWLPLFNGSDPIFSGVCIDQIALELAHYPLKEKVQDNVINSYKQQEGDLHNCHSFLVAMQTSCWTSSILGTIQRKCFSYHLDSPFTFYRSWVKNGDSTRGVIGGAHKIIAEIESKYHINKITFISDQYKCVSSQSRCFIIALLSKKDFFNDLVSNTDEILEPSNDQMKVEQLHSSLLVRNL